MVTGFVSLIQTCKYPSNFRCELHDCYLGYRPNWDNHLWTDDLLHLRWSARLDVRVAACFAQRMKTKWGSCNHLTRHIRLNTELVKKPMDLLEYVVAHEMVHLLEPKHSERFIAILSEHYPTCREARMELNELPLAAETRKDHDIATYAPIARVPTFLRCPYRILVTRADLIDCPSHMKRRVQWRWQNGDKPYLKSASWAVYPGAGPRARKFALRVCQKLVGT